MTATISDARTTAALKIRYKDGIEHEDYSKVPTLYKLVGRKTDFNGASYDFVINSDGTQGVGPSVGEAQASLEQSNNFKFAVTRVRYYSLARVTGEAMMAAKGAGAVMDLWEHEVKEATYTLNRELAIQFHRAGTGSRAQLATSSSGVASATVTLANPEEAVLFSLYMYVQGSSSTTDNGTLVSTNAVQISGIDRAAGTLTTAGGNWSTQIPGLADGAHLHRRGDAKNGGTAKTLTGVRSWIDSAAGALFGLTRTDDKVKKAGQVTSVSGQPIEEVIPTLLSKLQIQGATAPDTAILHPKMGDRLRKALIARSMYVRNEVKGAAGISYKGFTVSGPDGEVNVFEDHCNKVDECIVTRKDAWTMLSLGQCPQILDFDKQNMLRVAADDAYEMRIGMYGNSATYRPVDTIIGTSVGA